jgi:hypothetical protein
VPNGGNFFYFALQFEGFTEDYFEEFLDVDGMGGRAED